MIDCNNPFSIYDYLHFEEIIYDLDILGYLNTHVYLMWYLEGKHLVIKKRSKMYRKSRARRIKANRNLRLLGIQHPGSCRHKNLKIKISKSRLQKRRRGIG